MPDGLRVNFSDKEAKAEGQGADLMPRGNYHVICTDGSWEQCGPASKNPGKPYWKIECTVQEGPYAGRHVFTNVMLFEGALYTLSQLMKAMGLDTSVGDVEVPDLEQVIGTHFVCGISVKKETEEYDARNEIRSFMAYNEAGAKLVATTAKGGATATRSKKSSSLLPG
jgi:hypothetical protein